MDKVNKFVSIGKIMKSHGVHGFAKIFPLTDFIERFEELGEVFLFDGENQKRKLKVEKVSISTNHILLKFVEINNPEEINKIKGYFLKIPAGEKYELPEDHFYIDDLIGLKAYTPDGKFLGEIINVYSLHQDIIEIKTPEKKEVMVPFVDEFIVNISQEENKIIIKTIPGLFDDQAEIAD